MNGHWLYHRLIVYLIYDYTKDYTMTIRVSPSLQSGDKKCLPWPATTAVVPIKYNIKIITVDWLLRCCCLSVCRSVTDRCQCCVSLCRAAFVDYRTFIIFTFLEIRSGWLLPQIRNNVLQTYNNKQTFKLRILFIMNIEYNTFWLLVR